MRGPRNSRAPRVSPRHCLPGPVPGVGSTAAGTLPAVPALMDGIAAQQAAPGPRSCSTTITAVAPPEGGGRHSKRDRPEPAGRIAHGGRRRREATVRRATGRDRHHHATLSGGPGRKRGSSNHGTGPSRGRGPVPWPDTRHLAQRSVPSAPTESPRRRPEERGATFGVDGVPPQQSQHGHARSGAGPGERHTDWTPQGKGCTDRLRWEPVAGHRVDVRTPRGPDLRPVTH